MSLLEKFNEKAEKFPLTMLGITASLGLVFATAAGYALSTAGLPPAIVGTGAFAAGGLGGIACLAPAFALVDKYLL